MVFGTCRSGETSAANGQTRRDNPMEESSMAIAFVFLAGLVGFGVASFAWIIGEVSIVGALGLYIAAGWSVILAGGLAAVVARMGRRSEPLAFHADGSLAAMLIERRSPQKSN
jgi:hypothetical protein